MALRKKNSNGNGPVSELDALKAQRQDLAQRLAATEAAAAGYDPLDDWERLSAAASEAGALERAIAAADRRIIEAERLAAATARDEREAATVERKRQAQQNVMAIAEQISVQAQQWRAGILADLEAAVMELHRAGSFEPAAVAQARHILNAVDGALAGWRGTAPEWVGLEPSPSREAQALAERQTRVRENEARFEDIRRQAKQGSGAAWSEVLKTYAHGVVSARTQLLRLTEPTLDGDEVFRRATAGTGDILSEYIGNYWESRRAEEAAKQRQAQAAEALAVAA